MEFRILKNDDGQFKVQRKGWIFWHDVGRHSKLMHGCLYIPQIVGTREEAEKIVEECERELRQSRWRVVGGKILPPRPGQHLQK